MSLPSPKSNMKLETADHMPVDVVDVGSAIGTPADQQGDKIGVLTTLPRDEDKQTRRTRSCLYIPGFIIVIMAITIGILAWQLAVANDHAQSREAESQEEAIPLTLTAKTLSGAGSVVDKFAVFADVDPAMYEEIRDLLDETKFDPNYLVLGGDLDYTEGDPGYPGGVGKYFGDYTSAEGENRKVIAAVGNHDNQPYMELFTDFFDIREGSKAPGGLTMPDKYYYSAIYGHTQWFVICSSSTFCNGERLKEGNAQAKWLETALESSRADSNIKFRFVLNHYSPLSTVAYGCEDEAADNIHWFPFAALGVDAIFSGHEHAYFRCHVPSDDDRRRDLSDYNKRAVTVNGHEFELNGWDGLVAVITGTGKNTPGRSDRSCSSYSGFDSYAKYDDDDQAQGAVMATVYENAIEFIYMSVDGSKLDDFSIWHSEGRNIWRL